MSEAGGHTPVMAGRVAELLAPALRLDGAVLVDATLGRAGHARSLLSAHSHLLLIGIDADPSAIERCRDLLAEYADRVRLVRARNDALPAILADLRVRTVHGVLFDLGMSSAQVDDADRGFAYSFEAPLDMRLDPTGPVTAADIVNGYPAPRLARLLRDYADERFARRIADAVVRERARMPITSSLRLAEIVRNAIPAPARRSGNPAKRTFQALRIEVNDEIGALKRALPAALDALAVGGRAVVLAYHSAEDSVVKRTLARACAQPAPPGVPLTATQSMPRFRLLTKGAERPSDAEIAANPRASSARLRAAERVLAA